MRFVIVSGLSGAGKSSVLKMLEDTGYFCVDNLPVALIEKFAELTFDTPSDISKVALGIDIRNGQALEELAGVLSFLKEKGYYYEIMFLDASTETLVKRYKESRRIHPLAGIGRVDAGIDAERGKLQFLKERADYIIDTSRLLIRELKTEIDKIFVRNEAYHSFYITVLSFGFKHGIPSDADLVMDVRFLPNPYYIEELKPLTGNDAKVSDYVMSFEVSKEFLNKLEDFMEFLIPNYITEGKNQLVIAIGCTGGQHRSVTLANALKVRLEQLEYGIRVEHRDVKGQNQVKNA